MVEVVTSVAEEVVALCGGGGGVGGGNGESAKLREEKVYFIGSRRFNGGKTQQHLCL